MRAKKVFENMGFERGQEPKDAMGVGYFAKSKDWSYKELTEAYIELLIQSKGKSFKKEMIWDLLKAIPNRLALKAGWANIDKIIYNLSYPDEFNIMKEVILKYLKLCMNHESKTIFENINFERNKDPKKIMDLGYPDSLEEIYTYVDKKIQTLKFVYLQREFAIGILNLIPERFKLKVGWGNVNNVFPEFTQKELDDMWEFLKKYYRIIKDVNNS